MTPEQLEALRAQADRHAQAIGPGGEKAWLAGLLAAAAPALLSEVERLRAELDQYMELLAGVRAERDEAVHQAREWRRETEALRPQLAVVEADRDKLSDELAQAQSLLGDLVIKATEYGVQDGDFVANYILPTGPLHRAMPWLEQRGIVVRPGFDGRKAVTQ